MNKNDYLIKGYCKVKGVAIRLQLNVKQRQNRSSSLEDGIQYEQCLNCGNVWEYQPEERE